MQIKQLKSMTASVQQWQEVEKEELDKRRTVLDGGGPVLSPVLAHQPVGVLLGGLIGGRVISEHGSSSRVGALYQVSVCSVSE